MVGAGVRVRKGNGERDTDPDFRVMIMNAVGQLNGTLMYRRTATERLQSPASYTYFNKASTRKASLVANRIIHDLR